MLQVAVRYEWALILLVVLAIGVVELIAIRRAIKKDRERAAGGPGKP